MTYINNIIAWHHDLGHGWLEVTAESAKEVEGISAYSYIRGGSVFLEEDCDAGRYLRHYGIKYDDLNGFVPTKYYNDEAPCRFYHYYEEEE